MNNPEPINLSRFFKTKAEARNFSTQLAKVSGSIFETAFQLEPALIAELGLQKKELFMVLLHEQTIVLEKPSAVKDFLTRLQNQINAMPVLALSIACEPNEAVLKSLSDWFLLSLKRQVLFDISVEPVLIGGLAIHYNGKYLDYTIRPIFLKVANEILNPQAAQPAIQTPPTAAVAQPAMAPAQAALVAPQPIPQPPVAVAPAPQATQPVATQPAQAMAG